MNGIKSKHNYMLTIANISVIGAEDNPDVAHFQQAVGDVRIKHAVSNAALYGRLSYIILLATAGPYMKVFGMPITPNANLQLIVDEMEVCMRKCKSVLLMHGFCQCVAE